MKERFYRNYLLTVLLIILAFSFADRSALGLLLQDIKVDLQLNDTQLGLLTGIAFALFYAVMGLPIARWADRGNRVMIISLTAALCGAMVALCGTSTNFWQLLLIRVGVAVGEAGSVPASSSLISDYFTRAERPRAIAIYMLGSSLSVVIGVFLAGWLNEFYGWRLTFVLLGLPGLILAALAWVTLREPRRDALRSAGPPSAAPAAGSLQREAASHTPEEPKLRTVALTLCRNATFRNLLLCFSVLYFFNYGTLQWQPAFFIRSYALETGQLGTWLAVIYGAGGVLGTYLGGELASRHAAHNECLQLKTVAWVIASLSIISVGAYLSRDRYLAFTLIALVIVGLAAATGPLFATLQTLVPPQMRAVAIAVVYLFANLIGMGLGPLATGALSDAFRPFAGEESLRYALLVLCPGYLWAGWQLWRSSQTVARDVEAVRGDHVDMVHGCDSSEKRRCSSEVGAQSLHSD